MRLIFNRFASIRGNAVVDCFRILAGVLALLTAGSTPSDGVEIQRPPNGSLRWILTLDKAAPGSLPGRTKLLGEQPELHFRIGLGNAGQGAVFGIRSLPATLDVRITSGGENVEIERDVAFEPAVSPVSLSPDESVRVRIVVRARDRSPFSAGQYAVAFDMRRFLATLSGESGAPWVGRGKRQETRWLTIASIETDEDRAVFHEVEGNFSLGDGRPQDAIRHFEEVLRIRPDSWHPRASLGAAYLRVGRFAEAAAAFEQSMPGWAKVRSHVGDFVPNGLASAYLRLGRAEHATRVLHQIGLSEEAVQERIQHLRDQR